MQQFLKSAPDFVRRSSNQQLGSLIETNGLFLCNVSPRSSGDRGDAAVAHYSEGAGSRKTKVKSARYRFDRRRKYRNHLFDTAGTDRGGSFKQVDVTDHPRRPISPAPVPAQAQKK